jgi:hypothetical protein
MGEDLVDEYNNQIYIIVSKIELQAIRLKAETEHDGANKIIGLIEELRKLI